MMCAAAAMDECADAPAMMKRRLGLQVGGPVFHAGNARTLEEVLNARFSGHHQSAIAPLFTMNATAIRQLVAFLMSIDESSAPIAIPALGATGGDLCHYP